MVPFAKESSPGAPLQQAGRDEAAAFGHDLDQAGPVALVAVGFDKDEVGDVARCPVATGSIRPWCFPTVSASSWTRQSSRPIPG